MELWLLEEILVLKFPLKKFPFLFIFLFPFSDDISPLFVSTSSCISDPFFVLFSTLWITLAKENKRKKVWLKNYFKNIWCHEHLMGQHYFPKGEFSDGFSLKESCEEGP